MFAWVGSKFDAILSTYLLGVVSSLMTAIAPVNAFAGKAEQPSVVPLMPVSVVSCVPSARSAMLVVLMVHLALTLSVTLKVPVAVPVW